MRAIIIGGGVAGLTAAHELLRCKFEVDVYEANNLPGGKARSLRLDDFPVGRGKEPLPAEHGFRFFPGFYEHIVDTLQNIPSPTHGTVDQCLVKVPSLHYARFDGDVVSVPSHLPRSFEETLELMQAWVGKAGLQFKLGEITAYAIRLWILLTASTERLMTEFETTPWWDFIGAKGRSLNYRRYFAGGARVLVAADPKRASTKTNGLLLERLLLDQVEDRADRILCGPTNQTWLFPWLHHLLQQPGFRYFMNARVTAIEASTASKQVTGIRVAHRSSTELFSQVIACDVRNGPELKTLELPESPLVADHYISAVPVERMPAFLLDAFSKPSALAQIDPGLLSLIKLSKHVQWMNGVIFYLKDEVQPLKGHAMYVDTPYALTSIFQGQHWAPDYALSRYGDGKLSEILSIVVSNWRDVEAGSPETCDIANCGIGRKSGKSASELIGMQNGRELLLDEVWTDVVESLLVDGGKRMLDKATVAHKFIDPDIVIAKTVDNLEPLLVNEVGAWALRPEAATRVGNFYLAADYVRTNTDLPCMEAACEAAKRAVNALLDANNLPGKRCTIHGIRRVLGDPFDEMRERDEHALFRGEDSPVRAAFGYPRAR